MSSILQTESAIRAWETPARTLEGVLAHAASRSPWPIMPNTYFVEPPSLA
jgi:hypothetical protein